MTVRTGLLLRCTSHAVALAIIIIAALQCSRLPARNECVMRMCVCVCVCVSFVQLYVLKDDLSVCISHMSSVYLLHACMRVRTHIYNGTYVPYVRAYVCTPSVHAPATLSDRNLGPDSHVYSGHRLVGSGDLYVVQGTIGYAAAAGAAGAAAGAAALSRHMMGRNHGRQRQIHVIPNPCDK